MCVFIVFGALLKKCFLAKNSAIIGGIAIARWIISAFICGAANSGTIGVPIQKGE